MIARHGNPGCYIKPAVFVILTTAYICGFPRLWKGMDMERLHIFLFNLCAGGTLLLHRTGKRSRPSAGVIAFCILSLVYALCAWLEFYLPSVAAALVMGLIAERVRRNNFPVLPLDFFTYRTPPSRLFHHGALLCLSLALPLSALVVANEAWLHLFHLRKLTLNVFFLGFSFPVSLMTFSMIFPSSIHRESGKNKPEGFILFWTISAGVGLFFVFIIMEWMIAEMVIAAILSLSVAYLFVYVLRCTGQVPRRPYILSGMAFLLLTAATGSAYIILGQMQAGVHFRESTVRFHAWLSLYGWNLTGLFLLSRKDETPPAPAAPLVLLHWVIILMLSPGAYLYPYLAIPAIIAWIFLLQQLFLRRT